jgi:hypothetical protein
MVIRVSAIEAIYTTGTTATYKAGTHERRQRAATTVTARRCRCRRRTIIGLNGNGGACRRVRLQYSIDGGSE